MAQQRLAQAAASQALYETEYDFTSFSAAEFGHDEHETIAVIYVKGGRVCALVVTRQRRCEWKLQLEDIANKCLTNSEKVPLHTRRAVDMIWVLKSSRRQGIATSIVRKLAEHCKISVDSLAHLPPMSDAAISLWRSLRLSTVYRAYSF
jgi:ribosomal protein S18 acetylase RimI-like enzyme